MITKSVHDVLSDALNPADKKSSSPSLSFDSDKTYKIFIDRLRSGLSEMSQTASAAQPFATRFLTASAKPFGMKNVSDVDHVAAGGVTTTATLCYPEGTDPADTD